MEHAGIYRKQITPFPVTHAPERLEKVFSAISDNFYALTGQSVAIRTTTGDYLSLEQNRFTDFCFAVNGSSRGSGICHNYLTQRETAGPDDVQLETCPFGLAKMLVPIFVGGECLAYVVNGQVLLPEQREAFFQNLPEIARQLELDYDQLYEHACKLKTIDRTQLEAQAQLLLMLTKYISLAEGEMEARTRYLQEHQRRTELEREKKEMELKFLQSQIRPHFIFNTLNVVALLARKENAPQVADLIYDFSDMLRLGTRSKDFLCSLERELKCVKSYLNIQSVRWGDKLRVHWEVEDAALDKMIPILSVQPLVENTIVHGMREEGTLEVTVEAALRDGKLVVTVADTGRGIEPQALYNLKAGQQVGTGIRNVEKRLALHYGEDACFDIKSYPGKGTTVVFGIPV